MIRDESDEGSSVKSCSYLVSRDSLFHFLHVKSQLELSWFIPQQISTAAVVWLIRNSRFCPLSFLKIYDIPGRFNITFQIKITVVSFQCIDFQSNVYIMFWYRTASHCFLILSGTYWCWLTDWPLTYLYPDQEESWGHAESWPIFPAHWTPDAPLQQLHHDNLQRAFRGQSSAHVHTLQACGAIHAYITITSSNNNCCYFVAV